MRRGILGGTFDPPHVAHLFAGEAAHGDLGLDVVTFIPAGAPWQKAHRSVSDAAHRWEMIQRAVVGVEYFTADDREVRREGWTYTADTLAGFPDTEELTLILGADAARGLPTWKRVDEVVNLARIAVVPRPGVDRREVDWALRGARAEWLDTPEVWLSGTMLRARRSAGRSLRFLVPEAVWGYVQHHGLYLDG